MSKLDEVIKNINSKLKNDILTTNIDAITFKGKEEIPYSTPALTRLFHGGHKAHTLFCFSGDYSSGKTSTAMSIAADFQKYYKKKWKDRVAELQTIEKPTKNEKQELATLLDNGYKKVAFIDVECSADSDWASKMGFDMEDVIYCKPQGESAEQLLEIALELIRSDGICLLILDSVAALASAAQTEKTMLEKSYGGASGVMTVWVSKLLPLLNKHDCSVIAINQLRDTIGSMVPGQTHMPGGRALSYQSHVILNFRKGKALDESYKEIPNKSENYFGQYVEVRVEKNKISKPDIRLTRLHILFDKGLYPLLDVVNLAIDYNIITKSGAWFTFEDEEGNPRIDSEENNMKWQGLTGVVKYFETHEKEYSELFDLVDKKVRENS